MIKDECKTPTGFLFSCDKLWYISFKEAACCWCKLIKSAKKDKYLKPDSTIKTSKGDGILI